MRASGIIRMLHEASSQASKIRQDVVALRGEHVSDSLNARNHEPPQEKISLLEPFTPAAPRLNDKWDPSSERSGERRASPVEDGLNLLPRELESTLEAAHDNVSSRTSKDGMVVQARVNPLMDTDLPLGEAQDYVGEFKKDKANQESSDVIINDILHGVIQSIETTDHDRSDRIDQCHDRIDSIDMTDCFALVGVSHSRQPQPDVTPDTRAIGVDVGVLVHASTTPMSDLTSVIDGMMYNEPSVTPSNDGPLPQRHVHATCSSISSSPEEVNGPSRAICMSANSVLLGSPSMPDSQFLVEDQKGVPMHMTLPIGGRVLLGSFSPQQISSEANITSTGAEARKSEVARAPNPNGNEGLERVELLKQVMDRAPPQLQSRPYFPGTKRSKGEGTTISEAKTFASCSGAALAIPTKMDICERLKKVNEAFNKNHPPPRSSLNPKTRASFTEGPSNLTNVKSAGVRYLDLISQVRLSKGCRLVDSLGHQMELEVATGSHTFTPSLEDPWVSNLHASGDNNSQHQLKITSQVCNHPGSNLSSPRRNSDLFRASHRLYPTSDAKIPQDTSGLAQKTMVSTISLTTLLDGGHNKEVGVLGSGAVPKTVNLRSKQRQVGRHGRQPVWGASAKRTHIISTAVAYSVSGRAPSHPLSLSSRRGPQGLALQPSSSILPKEISSNDRKTMPIKSKKHVLVEKSPADHCPSRFKKGSVTGGSSWGGSPTCTPSPWVIHNLHEEKIDQEGGKGSSRHWLTLFPGESLESYLTSEHNDDGIHSGVPPIGNNSQSPHFDNKERSYSPPKKGASLRKSENGFREEGQIEGDACGVDLTTNSLYVIGDHLEEGGKIIGDGCDEGSIGPMTFFSVPSCLSPQIHKHSDGNISCDPEIPTNSAVSPGRLGECPKIYNACIGSSGSKSMIGMLQPGLQMSGNSPPSALCQKTSEFPTHETSLSPRCHEKVEMHDHEVILNEEGLGACIKKTPLSSHDRHNEEEDSEEDCDFFTPMKATPLSSTTPMTIGSISGDIFLTPMPGSGSGLSESMKCHHHRSSNYENQHDPSYSRKETICDNRPQQQPSNPGDPMTTYTQLERMSLDAQGSEKAIQGKAVILGEVSRPSFPLAPSQTTDALSPSSCIDQQMCLQEAIEVNPDSHVQETKICMFLPDTLTCPNPNINVLRSNSEDEGPMIPVQGGKQIPGSFLHGECSPLPPLCRLVRETDEDFQVHTMSSVNQWLDISASDLLGREHSVGTRTSHPLRQSDPCLVLPEGLKIKHGQEINVEDVMIQSDHDASATECEVNHELHEEHEINVQHVDMQNPRDPTADEQALDIAMHHLELELGLNVERQPNRQPQHKADECMNKVFLQTRPSPHKILRARPGGEVALLRSPRASQPVALLRSPRAAEPVALLRSPGVAQPAALLKSPGATQPVLSPNFEHLRNEERIVAGTSGTTTTASTARSPTLPPRVPPLSPSTTTTPAVRSPLPFPPPLSPLSIAEGAPRGSFTPPPTTHTPLPLPLNGATPNACSPKGLALIRVSPPTLSPSLPSPSTQGYARKHSLNSRSHGFPLTTGHGQGFLEKGASRSSREGVSPLTIGQGPSTPVFSTSASPKRALTRVSAHHDDERIANSVASHDVDLLGCNVLSPTASTTLEDSLQRLTCLEASELHEVVIIKMDKQGATSIDSLEEDNKMGRERKETSLKGGQSCRQQKITQSTSADRMALLADMLIGSETTDGDLLALLHRGFKIDFFEVVSGVFEGPQLDHASSLLSGMKGLLGCLRGQQTRMRFDLVPLGSSGCSMSRPESEPHHIEDREGNMQVTLVLEGGSRKPMSLRVRSFTYHPGPWHIRSTLILDCLSHQDHTMQGTKVSIGMSNPSDYAVVVLGLSVALGPMK